MWISVEHFQAATNIIADSLCRKNVDMECKLDETIFEKVQNLCGKCDLDLLVQEQSSVRKLFFK